MLQGIQPADDGPLMERQPEAMAKLEAEGLHLVLEAEVLRLRPRLRDRVGGHTGLDEVDAGIDPLACLLVGIALALGRAADIEGPVIAGAVAVIGLDDVEERLVAGA